MIELKNINKHYETPTHTFHALKNINLSVLPGEIVGVIGRSGAGKSTLIRCVNLLERPTSGSVIVNNTELTALNAPALREARHQIGMVFQHFNLLSTLNVYENVAFPLKLLKKSPDEIEKIVLPLLDKVGLMKFYLSYPAQLSGGQKQRVAIARALATKPTVLLCDEMTSALDPETTDEILDLIRTLNAEMRLSILCITHEMHVIKSIADRVAVLDHGELIECSPVIELFKNPKTAIAKRFVASVLKSTLPHAMQSQLHFEPMSEDWAVLQLTFVGHATLEPVMDELMRKTHIKVSILQANIEQLRNEMIGRMIVALEVGHKKIDDVYHYLQEKGLHVEVMGYVDRNVWVDR